MVLIGHANACVTQGHPWTVLAPTGRVSEQLAAREIPHRAIRELKLGPGPRPIAAVKLLARNLRSLATVRRAVRDADVIVANSVLCLPVLRLARPKAPVVWLVHDVITRGDLARIARWMSKVVARSVAVSEAAGAMSRQLGIPTTVVYNGVEAQPVTEVEPEQPPIVGLNAVLTHWKGQHVLLDAIGLLGGSTRVELLGGSLPKEKPYEEQLRNRSEQPDLVGRVRFVGHRDRPADTMRRWSVGVSASVEPEAGPLSVLEGMALALPMIVTDHGGAPEIVGDCGVVVPVGDAAALAQAIGELIEDRERATRLGIAGRDRMMANFDRADLAARFYAVLREVADAADRTRRR